MINTINKTKSEKIIFWGFITLALSFFAMVWYFNKQSNVLNEIEEGLKIKQAILNTKELQLKQLEQNVDIVKVDSIKAIADSVLKEEIVKITTENKQHNNTIFIQVGSEKTKNNLINNNFINTIKSSKFNLIDAYDIEANADNTIRYFDKKDESLAMDLKNEIEHNFKDIKLKVVGLKNYTSHAGQLELWIK